MQGDLEGQELSGSQGGGAGDELGGRIADGAGGECKLSGEGILRNNALGIDLDAIRAHQGRGKGRGVEDADTSYNICDDGGWNRGGASTFLENRGGEAARIVLVSACLILVVDGERVRMSGLVGRQQALNDSVGHLCTGIRGQCCDRARPQQHSDGEGD